MRKTVVEVFLARARSWQTRSASLKKEPVITSSLVLIRLFQQTPIGCVYP